MGSADCTWYKASDNCADHERGERHRSHGQMSGRTEHVVDPAGKDGRVETVDRRHAGQQRKTHSLNSHTAQQYCSSSSQCRPSGCTVASGVGVVVVVVVGGGVCNRSQMKTSKCTCLIFGVSIGVDPG